MTNLDILFQLMQEITGQSLSTVRQDYERTCKETGRRLDEGPPHSQEEVEILIKSLRADWERILPSLTGRTVSATAPQDKLRRLKPTHRRRNRRK